MIQRAWIVCSVVAGLAACAVLPTTSLVQIYERGTGKTGVGLMCVYFNEIGERRAAETLHSALQEVAPESEMVTFAKEFLYPSLLSKLRKWARRKRLKIERAQTEHEKNIIKRMPDKKEKDDDYNLEA
jgi:hypothetical protein